MKLKYFIGIMVLCIVLLVGALSYFPIAQTTLTWEGVLPHIYTGADGDYAINVAYTASTTGWDVSEETSTTNALVEVESVTLTTSGTPAANLGPKKTWTVETSASHNEDIGYIGFSIADGTLDSEDGDFEIGNMAAGAAAATKWTLGSTGIVTQVGGATLDNATAATELNITETNIQLTGAMDFEGGNVAFNEDSGDYDFKIETDSTDSAFAIDSGASTLTVDGLSATINQAGGDYDTTIESDNVATAFVVNAGNDSVVIGTFAQFKTKSVTAATETIDTADDATHVLVTYTDTGTVAITLDTDLVAFAGLCLTFIDTELNANNNNITISTEGAETINEAATYVMNAAGEAVTLMADGTNWVVVGGYLE